MIWQDGPVTVHIGDALSVLRELPAESVQCIVTSPPYWGLRDYGIPGQLGLEATPEEYIARMVTVFGEVRRVLRPDGTLWLNMGDAYAHSSSGGGGAVDVRTDGRKTTPGDQVRGRMAGANTIANGLKPKDLVGIPWRLALALQADGWWLRSDIIWAKPNPMPESVTDRPTKAHEYIFLLTKSARYFYDAEAVREPQTSPDNRDNPASRNGVSRPEYEPVRPDGPLTRERIPMRNREWNPAGRNLRSVWTIATQPYPEAHFATFPEELARRCIAAGTSERGCCPECEAPWERRRSWPELGALLKKAREAANLTPVEVAKRANIPSAASIHDWEQGGHVPDASHWARLAKVLSIPARGEFVAQYDYLSPFISGDHPGETLKYGARGTVKRMGDGKILVDIGWRPTCGHDREPAPCTVLDPFAGSGTTLAVARRMGRRAVGIELQPDYLPLIQRRVSEAALPLLEAIS